MHGVSLGSNACLRLSIPTAIGLGNSVASRETSRVKERCEIDFSHRVTVMSQIASRPLKDIGVISSAEDLVIDAASDGNNRSDHSLRELKSADVPWKLRSAAAVTSKSKG